MICDIAPSLPLSIFHIIRKAVDGPDYAFLQRGEYALRKGRNRFSRYPSDAPSSYSVGMLAAKFLILLVEPMSARVGLACVDFHRATSKNYIDS